MRSQYQEIHAKNLRFFAVDFEQICRLSLYEVKISRPANQISF